LKYYYKIEQEHPCEDAVVGAGSATGFPLFEGRAELLRVNFSVDEEFVSGLIETLMGVG
jgi:hypothetical protein